jgi:LuxR family maltose regulon positive regulatory protein
VPGLRALSLLDEGRLGEAEAAAESAALEARRLGVAEHVISGDHLRALAGLALERRDLVRAEQLTQEVLSLSAGRSPLLEYQAGLDQAAILLTRGLVHEALASIETAREVLPQPGRILLARAASLEAEARLALGDIRSATDLTALVPHPADRLLRARLALASGEPELARSELYAMPADALTPRRALLRELLLAAAAIEQGDRGAESIVGAALFAARRIGFCNTVVTTAAQVTTHVVGHATPVAQDPYYESLVQAALEVRATATRFVEPPQVTLDQLTKAEQRVLDLLPTHTYRQIAAALYVSPHTVKSHLRSVYRKIGAESRAEALERAVELRLL